MSPIEEKKINECIAAYQRIIAYMESQIEELEARKRVKQNAHRFKIHDRRPM